MYLILLLGIYHNSVISNNLAKPMDAVLYCKKRVFYHAETKLLVLRFAPATLPHPLGGRHAHTNRTDVRARHKLLMVLLLLRVSRQDGRRIVLQAHRANAGALFVMFAA